MSKPPVPRRPYTDLERDRAVALGTVRFGGGNSFSRRFSRDISRAAVEQLDSGITDNQAEQLARLCWTYRRQIPASLVPDHQPADRRAKLPPPPSVAAPEPSPAPAPVHGRDRAAYVAECALRWHGVCLADAKRNWTLFEERHAALVGILQPYLRDCWVEDLSGKCQNPDGTLTSWLWKCHREHPFVLDFCDHYQRCHLRRGLIAYCKQVIFELNQKDGSKSDQADDLPGLLPL